MVGKNLSSYKCFLSNDSGKLYKYRKNQHASFWQNLKEGSDHFEVTGQEPIVNVCAKRYMFNQVPFDPNSRFEATAHVRQQLYQPIFRQR